MFTERIRFLLKRLEASNGALAYFAGCDRSNISRIKSGARQLKPTGAAVQKLVSGIYLFADDQNKLPVLAETIGVSPTLSAGQMQRQTLLWLYQGSVALQSENGALTLPKTRFQSFGSRLDSAMHLTDLSNVRLGKILHVDASTISRFRNGLRSPKTNPKLTEELCQVLYARITELGQLEELKKIAKIQADMTDDEECFAVFRRWLCDFESEEDSSLVEHLLENIASFSADLRMPLPTWQEAAPETVLQSTAPLYFGTDGIREAVIRFLGGAIRQGAKALWLYSDQNMEWMTGDLSFRLRWTALMRTCVQSGIKIRIIHNLARNLQEMTDAINSWLPLYMSGMIESYYCTRQTSGRFSHTIFLCPGFACINSVHVAGCEQKGIYRYDTDKTLLKIHEDAYKKLLGMSKQLVYSFNEAETEKLYGIGANVTTISDTLPLGAMPEHVLQTILNRYDAAPKHRRAVIRQWEAKRRLLEKGFAEGYVHTCLHLADKQALAEGKAAVDVRGIDLFYTCDEYLAHAEHMIALSEQYAGYRFYALPEVPFENIEVVISETAVLVTRKCPPYLTFVFFHPAMCEAFGGYADGLKRQYRQDKATFRRQIAEILADDETAQSDL